MFRWPSTMSGRWKKFREFPRIVLKRGLFPSQSTAAPVERSKG